MGARKRLRAEKIKEEKKNQYFAVLRGCPVSPRKMRLVADMIKGKEVNQALDMLRYSPKAASNHMEKLVLSAISNWQNKNEGVRIEDSHLVISSVNVDKARTLKRIRPEAMGRAHLIRKRSNHVTVYLEDLNQAKELNTTQTKAKDKAEVTEEQNKNDSKTNQQ